MTSPQHPSSPAAVLSPTTYPFLFGTHGLRPKDITWRSNRLAIPLLFADLSATTAALPAGPGHRSAVLHRAAEPTITRAAECLPEPSAGTGSDPPEGALLNAYLRQVMA